MLMLLPRNTAYDSDLHKHTLEVSKLQEHFPGLALTRCQYKLLPLPFACSSEVRTEWKF